MSTLLSEETYNVDLSHIYAQIHFHGNIFYSCRGNKRLEMKKTASLPLSNACDHVAERIQSLPKVAPLMLNAKQVYLSSKLQPSVHTPVNSSCEMTCYSLMSSILVLPPDKSHSHWFIGQNLYEETELYCFRPHSNLDVLETSMILLVGEWKILYITPGNS